MRLLGNLLVWICLATGLMGVSSFYAWPVGKDGASDARFELGVDEDGDPAYARVLRDVATGDGRVIAPEDAVLDPGTLALIREAGMGRVIVKHPSGAYGRMLGNWTGKWVFLGSAIGLVGGGLLIRSSARREAERAHLSEKPVASPEDVAGRIRGAIADLRGSLATLSSEQEKMHTIVLALGEVQAELVPMFVETRAVLIARRGVGGFARVMDSFAAMERKINRSWSAAADGMYAESVGSLDGAASAGDRLGEMLAGAS